LLRHISIQFYGLVEQALHNIKTVPFHSTGELLRHISIQFYGLQSKLYIILKPFRFTGGTIAAYF
ncbi:MAG: hypothetical protein LBK53_03370, partial [Heliobacteriaceae bacterium]|nr:hypothetical protein [Heliobacteriaceae bacterium]